MYGGGVMEYWEESMGANTLQAVLDENKDLKEQLEKANERVKELEQQLSEVRQYTFRHSKNGDTKTVFIDRDFIVDRLMDEIYEKIECGCEPVGETNVVECDCDEYFENFDLVSPEQLLKEQEK